jgi:cbb3-type cytochrome oxidase subunit 3
MERKPSLIIFFLFIFFIGSFFYFFQTQKEKRRVFASKEEIFSDAISRELKEKTLKLFKNYNFAEEISDFVVIANLFEGTAEYGKIYLKNLDNLNLNPFLVFFAIREKIGEISAEDFIIRGELLTLVDKLEIPPEKKSEFFGEQIIRRIEFDSEGYLSDDSKNIAHALTFFRQHAKNENDVLKFANSALVLNQDNKKAVSQLISRLKIYFPQAAKNLEVPQITKK